MRVEFVLLIAFTLTLGSLVVLVIAPGTRWRRSLLAALTVGVTWWGLGALHSSATSDLREFDDRESRRGDLCRATARHLIYLSQRNELYNDRRDVLFDAWTSMQLEGHGTIRVIGPVLRYCVRDAASCDGTIQALLDGQRPEAPFSTAPTYRAHLKVLADAFENREGCKP